MLETIKLAKNAAPTSRKINGKTLTQDVQLTATDVNAVTTEILRTEIPVGVPLPWPTEKAPTGWFICNGEPFDKKKYPLLALAYPSGKLPDLRGEFIRGWDAGRGVDNGRVLQSKQGDTIRNITGSLFYGYDADIATPTKNASTGATYYDTREKLRDTENGLTVSINQNYNSWYPAKLDASRVVPTSNENRPRNIAFNYIVRAA